MQVPDTRSVTPRERVLLDRSAEERPAWQRGLWLFRADCERGCSACPLFAFPVFALHLWSGYDVALEEGVSRGTVLPQTSTSPIRPEVTHEPGELSLLSATTGYFRYPARRSLSVSLWCAAFGTGGRISPLRFEFSVNSEFNG